MRDQLFFGGIAFLNGPPCRRVATAAESARYRASATCRLETAPIRNGEKLLTRFALS